jgi:hypothetical protein
MEVISDFSLFRAITLLPHAIVLTPFGGIIDASPRFEKLLEEKDLELTRWGEDQVWRELERGLDSPDWVGTTTSLWLAAERISRPFRI